MKIAVLCGGLSPERNVSISSGTKIAGALQESGHQVVLLDMFFGLEDYTGDIAHVFDDPPALGGTRIDESAPDLEAVRAQRKLQSPSLFGEHVLEVCAMADIVFLALHGRTGEDGRVQATLDLLGIPYTGSGYLGSAIAMDKDLTKRVVAPLGVKTPAWMLVESDGMDIDAICAQAKLPCVVKPDDSGSSIGVSIANDEAELRAALKAAANEGSRILIEQYICGREVQIGILGDKALPSIEIIPAEGFYDYRNKYQPGAAREITPAEIPAETEQRLADAALTVFHALNLSAYSRADFILDAEGELWFLEINTLPGMTPTSLVPQEAAAVGISYSELCEQIIAAALHSEPMTGYCVSDIAAITGGVLSGDGAALVTGVAIDSRAVTPGALFAAIPGERVDGHDYIGKAFDLGAVCCLAQRVPAGETRPVICVPDTAAALETLARAYRARFSIPVLGVTGSVGKTTAKEMVASVLSQRWNTLKTEKNFNNQLGVPLTLFRLGPEHEAAVVEMGVSHFGDMAPLAAMVQPTAMLFTIIGHAHLEFLRDRRGVLQEKTSVLDTMPDDAVAFCNGDDDLLRAMTCRQRKVTFGLSAGCDVRAVDVRDLGDEGSTCTIIAGTRRIPVRISAYGQHMVYAALEGAAVGIEYGLTDDEIIRGIAAYQPVGSRARVVRTARYTVIDDCYNANPDSTAAALRSMATLPAGRRVAVLGNMGELGTNAAALHRETGVCAAKAGVSLVITCGELARQIAAGAAAEDPAVATASFDTLDALLPALPGLLQPGDCVLVKASHSMQFERIVQALTQA